MRRTSLFLAFLALAAGCATTVPVTKNAPDKEAILETIDAFFLALASGDADAIEALAGETTVTVAIRPDQDVEPRYGELKELIDAFRAGRGTKVVEPYWSPTVLQRKDLAVVWAPYEVSVNGHLIHCGIDSFQMSRTADGW